MEFETLWERLKQKAREKMPGHLQRLNFTREERIEHQQKALARLLIYVKKHTPYYQKSLKEIDVENFKLADMGTLPVTTKQDTLLHWNDFVSDGVVTKAQAEQHLQALRDDPTVNPFYKEKYFIFATGGSSGRRGLFIWSDDDFADVICAFHRYMVRDDQRLGKSCKKISVVVSPSWLHMSQAVNIFDYDPSTLVQYISADLPAKAMVERLEEFQPDLLMGFSTSIAELAHLATCGRLNIKPNRVCTHSEPLLDDDRQVIREAWQVEVNNLWGSTEVGVTGFEDDEHLGLWISEDCCLIEAVDEDLQPVSQPQETKNLLVTSLINYTFPLIRYVLDDAVPIEELEDRGFRLARHITGRADRWFVYSGNVKVHPIAFRHVLGQDKNIQEYQVTQTKQGAEVAVVTEGEASLTTVEQALKQELLQAGLVQPEVVVRRVTKLERHAETGKRKRFIPLGV